MHLPVAYSLLGHKNISPVLHHTEPIRGFNVFLNSSNSLHKVFREFQVCSRCRFVLQPENVTYKKSKLLLSEDYPPSHHPKWTLTEVIRNAPPLPTQLCCGSPTSETYSIFFPMLSMAIKGKWITFRGTMKQP